MTSRFIIEGLQGRKELAYTFKGAVICGYTGRNQDAVRRHIQELEKEGVKPPPSVPMFYPKPSWCLSLEEDMRLEGKETSGEVEYVLLMEKGRIYVGVGSDHTDRELERLSIPKSKQVCPAVISMNLWDYEEIKGHWDKIQIRSWVMKGGRKTLYQESTLGTILPPEALMDLVRGRVHGHLDGLAVFSGTPPLLTEGFVFAEGFEGELLDPALGRKLGVRYTIHTLDWFKTL